jgi:hypothetical protein
VWICYSSLQYFPKLMCGFENARSPCWLRKTQRNNFQRWHVDSLTPTAFVTQK